MQKDAGDYPQKYFEMSDEQLAAVALSDNDCFGELLRRYQKKLLNYVFKFYFLDRQACEDVVQETFISVYNALKGFDSSRKFRPWLYKIAENTAKNYLREIKLNACLPMIFEPAAGEDPERSMDESFFLASFYEKVQDLPKSQRMIALLYFSGQLSPKEIAGKINLPATVVRTNIDAARRAILSQLIIEN